MRISDWSSDVCSSDLGLQGHEDRRFAQPAAQPDANDTEDPTQQERQAPGVVEDLRRGEDLRQRRGGQGAKQIAEGQASLEEDRKSVVSGKSVSVRVDLGGRRIFKKNNTTNTTKTKH